ncbi:MAG TPA: hypothetical protein RMH85_14930 [Polyangiaceae bacterium LLY-WYZ-15_(1-7)]|nr:hypothetical protein [Polyangiaceae bacterium LLY-WYZ-15_(1-7)]HJL09791.1 hypothetical protein [Polyangiaceae bacterium LLY-WYZ-15_(1-7)]HJL25876.1 hypothetical protein [Polyangiaceae bacterium LLY-WYZ-15_(1-7)]HJL30779.1 hypothetical protein [Polyangiaceae bacterium LLY-WYZ-15_(1-7)]HJL36198.1 hypothetical protein [Polyangiaceae bacterium LLY-WYZ-15_(1-7)]
MRWGMVALGALFALGAASPARAYLIDANDATTVSPGHLEIELQAVGWWQTFGPDGERAFVAPSLMLYVGLAERADLILLSRGYAAVRPRGFTLDDGAALVRVALREGSYHEGGGPGPSVVLQAGVYLPSLDVDEGVGGWGLSYALLLSHEGDHLAVHANAQVDLRYGLETPAFFGALVLEGPLDWAVRPTVEAFVDVELAPGEASTDLSALVGLVGDVNEDLALMGGVRVGDLLGDRELELRLSLWAAFDLRRRRAQVRPLPRPAPDR